MKPLKQTGLVLLATTAALYGSGEAWARQNIIIGELSIGYDFQERNYKQSERFDSDEGDTRSLFATPRVRFSSRDVGDLLEFTYAPTFTYDDVDSRDIVGHDLNLLAEKNITRDWVIRASNSYFKGEDSVTDNEGRRSPIIPGATEPTTSQPPGAGEPTDAVRELSDVNGRQKYWRNDLGLRTDYTYAQDSIVGMEYNFGVLRYDEEDAGSGESDYDRHEWIGRLSYRFDAQWQLLTELGYVRGLYDEVGGTDPRENDDLEEYRAMIRTNYAWRPRDIFFGRYQFTETAYDEDSRQDAAIHEFTVGWDHDFSETLRMTLSGGPSFVTFEDSDDEVGYNAYAGLVWRVQPQTTLSAQTSYRYEFDNFDGLQTGLSKTWASGLSCTHQFSPQWHTDISTNYTRSDNDEASGTVVTNDSDRFNYREETYDVGLGVRYTFLQRYTLGASYRYSDHSEPNNDYDEHRVLLTLTAATELFRW